MQTPEKLQRLLARQASVITRSQAVQAGLTPAAVEHRLHTETWRRLHARVYVAHSGPVGRESRAWAAVLYAGTGAVLSHESAADRLGWRVTPEHMTVTVPRGRRVRAAPGLVVVRADLVTGDYAMHRGVPVTRPVRTAVDLVARSTSYGEALDWIFEAVRTRGATPAALRDALRDRPRWKWRAALLPALEDISEGSSSHLELAFVRLLRSHGLPVGARQVPLMAGGARYRLDMAYDDGVVIELDGRLGHERPGERHRDMHRDNANALRARTTLRFGWLDVQTDGCAVAGMVARALGRQPRKCGNRCSL